MSPLALFVLANSGYKVLPSYAFLAQWANTNRQYGLCDSLPDDAGNAIWGKWPRDARLFSQDRFLHL